MRRSALFALFALLLVPACGTDPELPPPSTELAGERGQFLFRVEPDGPLQAGPCPLTVTLHDAADGAAVEGAVVSVTARMPAMGHPGGGTPVSTEAPGGVYHVDGLLLSMAGSWELRVDATKGERADAVSVTWELQ